MWRSKIATIALVAALFATTLSAQTFLQEDWSTAVGNTPPTGWSAVNIGANSVPWEWNNVAGRVFDAPPFAGQFALCDTDWFGSSAFGFSVLRSPTFNASGTSLLNLTFDHNYRHLSGSPMSGIAVDMWDGTSWNSVASWNANVGYLAPNASTVVSEMFDVTAAAGGSANAQLRFTYGYGWDWWWAIDNVKIEQPSPIDLAVISIDSPVDNPTACLPPTGLQTVTATIENQGSMTIFAGSLIQLDFSVNMGPPTTEFLIPAADLLPNTTTQFTFTAQANLPAPGPNTLSVTVIYPGDGDPSDDTKTETLSGLAGIGSVTLPFLENFDSAIGTYNTAVPAGWIQDTMDATGFDSDWYMQTGQTGSLNTGPMADHTTGTTGHYAFVEDSGNYAAVNLISPCFDLSLNVSPQANFWMHSYNGNPGGSTTGENFLSVDVIAYPGGAVTMDVFGPQGHLPGQGATWGAGNSWQQQTVNLAPFAGSIVQLVWRVDSSNGGANTFYHDVAIDDVAVFEPMPTPGQAPRSGMAAFDINSALNVNTSAVPSGLGGPYFANVTQGGTMSMSFDGVPSQPIAVVYGALNPVSATYPGGIGQFDIGGPGVDPMGLPLNIGVFVNAIAWASAPVGFPIDSLFFTDATGQVTVNFLFPNFGIPGGSILTTFQSAITDTVAPFVYLSNAIQVTVN